MNIIGVLSALASAALVQVSPFISYMSPFIIHQIVVFFPCKPRNLLTGCFLSISELQYPAIIIYVTLIMHGLPFNWSLYGYTDTRGIALSASISGFIPSQRL